MERFGTMDAIQAESLMGTVAHSVGTVINREKARLRCELILDGSRFQAMIPPVVAAPTFTIRKRALLIFTLENYVEQGIMTELQRATIECAVHEKQNILIVGGTGTGKTTLTNAVLRYMVDVCPQDRLVIIEDTIELQCEAENVVLLKSTEEVNATMLVRDTLRMRPDRILIGEVSDGSAHALLKAWNTGHPGGVTTFHANSALEAFSRLEQLVLEATPFPSQRLIGDAVQLIVYIEKCAGGRKVQEIVQVSGYDGQKYVTESVGG
jgi:type IV secretion system protein VirB11